MAALLKTTEPWRKMLIVLAFTTFVGCDFKSDREEYAEMIIRKTEEFQGQTGRLPNDVGDIGLTEQMDSPAFYEKTSDSSYKVWYGLSLGESRTFNSATREWTRGG